MASHDKRTIGQTFGIFQDNYQTNLILALDENMLQMLRDDVNAPEWASNVAHARLRNMRSAVKEVREAMATEPRPYVSSLAASVPTQNAL